jgi:ribosomal protein L37AE/L43A
MTKHKCEHCGRAFHTRAARTIHEASSCPERPGTTKAG